MKIEDLESFFNFPLYTPNHGWEPTGYYLPTWTNPDMWVKKWENERFYALYQGDFILAKTKNNYDN